MLERSDPTSAEAGIVAAGRISDQREARDSSIGISR
jgi:hypothetical protein